MTKAYEINQQNATCTTSSFLPPTSCGDDEGPGGLKPVNRIEYRPAVRLRHEIFNDHFQNYKTYSIPKAQLVIADIPYNVGKNAYGSNPVWYIDGDNKNGESKLANSSFFDTDKDFRISEYLHFCSKMIVKEPKEPGRAGAMIIFCSFEQQFELIQKAREHGFKNYINLVFVKNSSAQVLKANMRICGNCEYGLVLYRDKLPKFRNEGKMVFNAFPWEKDNKSPKIHPTQKPIKILQRLINIFTDPGDVVIDPVAGSGATVIAALKTGRSGYGFEIKKEFYNSAMTWLRKESGQGVLPI